MPIGLWSMCVSLLLASAGGGPLAASQPTSQNLLRSRRFELGEPPAALPAGWSIYGTRDSRRRVRIVEVAGAGAALLIEDDDPAGEIGVTQVVPARPGLTYRATAEVRDLPGRPAFGAYLQLRFQPSNRLVQTSLATGNAEQFEAVTVQATAPPGTTQVRIYIYTHAGPTPRLLVKRVELVSFRGPPVPPQPPPPVPPVYTRLKDLHLRTWLVKDGRPAATIISPASGVYAEAAERIEAAIQTLTGVQVPIAPDDSPEAAVPVAGNLIVLGNRSTNRTISELYDRFYTLLDLRYPGPGGYVVRTLHNPFGNGHNVVFAGGSDRAGVSAAAAVLVDELKKAGGRDGGLSLGWLARIKLGRGIKLPADPRQFRTWDASAGYGSVGYFGWNSISKRMAMYYMTGDPVHARQFLRLAFPDEQAKQQIAKVDGERIENKDDPLAGPYHYTAHMMILFWDLIEESPVFTDRERLRVTNAFARQLRHRVREGIYGRTTPPPAVGSRHAQWSAISLYCLGRYFQRDYPSPVWRHCVQAARLHFQPLHRHAWVYGESDNLFWYNTGIAPILTYMLLTGDREPLRCGVLGRLLRGQEMLISGRQPDWALRSASVGFLHKAAYLTGDGRWVTYRQRAGVDTGLFRLGQSFWPGPELKPEPPQDLAGKWSVYRLPKPMWQARASGLPMDESFQFGSFRSDAGAGGDFILIDGYNGASRNPYHTFAVLELRLAGYTLLHGYRNQVITRADGLTEPKIAMDAALKACDVLGQTAAVVAEVPNAAWCNWRRTLVQRVGRYALVVDRLRPRIDTESFEVQVLWEPERTARTFEDGHIEFPASAEVPERRTEPGGQVWPSRLMTATGSGRVVTQQWLGPARSGRPLLFFSLLGMQPGAKSGSLGCMALGESAAALLLPEPALAFVGSYGRQRAELAVVAPTHLYARRARRLGLPQSESPSLVAADQPLDLDWDFDTGTLAVAARQPARLRLRLAAGAQLQLDGRTVAGRPDGTGLATVPLPAGQHLLRGARPAEQVRRQLADQLAAVAAEARRARGRRLAERRSALAKAAAAPALPPLTVRWTADVGGKVVDVVTVPAGRSPGASCRLYAAENKTVHVLDGNGRSLHTLPATGRVRVLRWWPEHRLLLAGCADEHVIAFDEAGRQRWVFTSEMDPAVYRAGKTYWFKSAPGHEGIHGLYSGVFMDGKSQAFVGSACTLEIIDEHGKLVRRLPQFWGKVSHFALIDGPNGTRNLLASRKYNGFNTVAIINSRTLDPNPRGFAGVPSGCTYMPGWSSMNRHHLFYTDLDGDGVKEVISETNGTWNRVTVWRADGKPLYDASFGPGQRIPARNMRDLDIADLDGDGAKEIVVATSAGLIVCLDHRCRLRWSTRLSSPPTVLMCSGPSGLAGAAKETAPAPPASTTGPKQPSGAARTLVGCEDGRVLALDGSGRPVRAGSVHGRPTCIAALDRSLSGTRAATVLLATDEGELKAFDIGP